LLEPLEDRRLLAAATEAFTGPSLSGLITQAFEGKNTAQAAIKTMLSALQTQLTQGPLVDLNSNTVNGNVDAGNIFVTEVQSLVASYNENVDQQLLPHFTHIDNMLKLEGQQVVANLVALNQQSTVNPLGTVVGLTSPDSLPTQAGAAINTLTGGPIHSLDTPVSAYVTATQTFETNLGDLASSLTFTAPTPPGKLTLPEVSTTIQAEAEAYRASMDAGLQVTHPDLSSTVNASVTTLESTVIAIANANDSSTAEADIHTAIATFDSAILDTTGLFGLNGPVNQVNSELGYVPHNLTAKPTATTIDGVSGTATFGGPATLTATLKSATGTGLVGKVVSFTLDGGFAGTAVTNSSGVATLTGVTQNDTVSTPGAIVASFAGDSTNLLSQKSGNLVVSQSSTTTTLTSSANPSTSGTSVTFTATVAAVSPGSGTPTGSVTFMADGTTITGSPVTLNSSGVATIATSNLTAGTHSITAVYSGDTNFTTSTGTLTQTVTSQAVPAITSAASTTFTVGTAGSFTVTATGAPTPTLSESGTLPSGVTFDATTAELSGTPASNTGGVYNLTFTAQNGVTPNAIQPFTLTVNQAPAITSAASTTFTVGTAGSFTVMTTGNPIAALTETGALPMGVTFVNNGNGTATLAGTPAAGTANTYSLTINATNSVGSATPQSFTLTVNPAPAASAPAITTTSSTTFTVGTAGSSFTVTATGTPTPTLSESGTLPSGVTFDATTGVLSGTPASNTGGVYNLTFTAQNSVGSDTQPFTLTVNQAPAITSATSTTFTVGAAGSFTVMTTGNPIPSPLTETGALPSGVTFVDNGNGTATLAGTPAAGTANTYAVTINATNSVGSATPQSFTLTVAPAAPTVTGLSPTSGPAAGGTSVTITGTNFTGATAVDFGTTAATTFTVGSDTSITATSPAGTGVVDVTVTTPGGKSTTSTNDQFTYA